MIPLRLGIEKVNDCYLPEIRRTLRNPFCIGIIGGRPNHAVYFVGMKGKYTLLGLDPHTVYGSAVVTPDVFPEESLLQQLHSENNLTEMSINKLDPSLAIGFYFRDRQEFDAFCESVACGGRSPKGEESAPLFNMQHVRATYAAGNFDDMDGDGSEFDKTEDDLDDEYVLV